MIALKIILKIRKKMKDEVKNMRSFRVEYNGCEICLREVELESPFEDPSFQNLEPSTFCTPTAECHEPGSSAVTIKS